MIHNSHILQHELFYLHFTSSTDSFITGGVAAPEAGFDGKHALDTERSDSDANEVVDKVEELRVDFKTSALVRI
jgi:hypothetical protein